MSETLSQYHVVDTYKEWRSDPVVGGAGGDVAEDEDACGQQGAGVAGQEDGVAQPQLVCISDKDKILFHTQKHTRKLVTSASCTH